MYRRNAQGVKPKDNYELFKDDNYEKELESRILNKLKYI